MANKDIIFNLINILLIILGWLAVFLLGLRQQKKQLRDSARMKVYEELYNIKLEYDEVCIDFGLLLDKYSLPFLDMSFESRKSEPEHQSNFNAITHWQKYLIKINEQKSKFANTYLKLWNHSDMWISVMPKLKYAKKELFENQLNKLGKELSQHIEYLQSQSIKQWNWELWGRKEIEERAEKISSLFDEIALGYADDYIGLVHNEIVSPIFGYKKIPRENFANLNKLSKYSILTENGLKKVKVKKQ